MPTAIPSPGLSKQVPPPMSEARDECKSESECEWHSWCKEKCLMAEMGTTMFSVMRMIPSLTRVLDEIEERFEDLVRQSSAHPHMLPNERALFTKLRVALAALTPVPIDALTQNAVREERLRIADLIDKLPADDGMHAATKLVNELRGL